MKSHAFLIFFIALALTLSGCSTTTMAYYNTLKLALRDTSVNFSEKDIASSKIDIIQIKAGARDTGALALAFIDGDKYKWISGDKVVFTIQNGVITQTEGLAYDVQYTGNLLHNPLASKDILPYSWSRKVDIDGVGYGLVVNSTWKVVGEVTHEYVGLDVPLIKIVEKVTFPETTPFLTMGNTWENVYFLDKRSKAVFATKQKLSPNGDVYDMVHLSKIVRAYGSQSKVEK